MRASATEVLGLAGKGAVTVAAAPRRPKLLDQLPEALRSRHYSRRTVQELLGHRDSRSTHAKTKRLVDQLVKLGFEVQLQPLVEAA